MIVNRSCIIIHAEETCRAVIELGILHLTNCTIFKTKLSKLLLKTRPCEYCPHMFLITKHTFIERPNPDTLEPPFRLYSRILETDYMGDIVINESRGSRIFELRTAMYRI